jgi:hypothetical protein
LYRQLTRTLPVVLASLQTPIAIRSPGGCGPGACFTPVPVPVATICAAYAWRRFLTYSAWFPGNRSLRKLAMPPQKYSSTQRVLAYICSLPLALAGDSELVTAESFRTGRGPTASSGDASAVRTGRRASESLPVPVPVTVPPLACASVRVHFSSSTVVRGSKHTWL